MSRNQEPLESILRWMFRRVDHFHFSQKLKYLKWNWLGPEDCELSVEVREVTEDNFFGKLAELAALAMDKDQRFWTRTQNVRGEPDSGEDLLSALETQRIVLGDTNAHLSGALKQEE